MQNDVLRTAVMRIMSDMLDNPDKHGIYETGRFMDRIEHLLVALMAAPEVLQLSGSEALFGFIAWLTTREEETTIVLGSTQDCAGLPDLIDEFCKINQLSDPREGWSELLTHPAKTERSRFS